MLAVPSTASDELAPLQAGFIKKHGLAPGLAGTGMEKKRARCNLRCTLSMFVAWPKLFVARNPFIFQLKIFPSCGTVVASLQAAAKDV